MGQPKLVLRRDRANDDGTAAVILQIYLKGKKVAITLPGMRVLPELWDDTAGTVSRAHPDWQDRQLELNAFLARAIEILKTYRLNNIALSAELFKREFKSQASRASFSGWMREKIEIEFERHLFTIGTRDKHLRTVRKIEAFNDGPVMFSEISRDWLERFDAWHAKQMLSTNYQGFRGRVTALKSIKKYLRSAQAEKKYFDDPFFGFVWPKYKARQVWLTQKEVKKMLWYYRRPLELELRLAELADQEGLSWHHKEQSLALGVPRMLKTLRAFLFQCFTGVRYSDLSTLTHRNIEHLHDGKYLVFEPKKTQDTSGKSVQMPINELIGELMNHKKGYLIETVSNQKYNQRLKEVSRLCGFNKELTSHAGRHTFATISLARGMSLEVLQELLGLNNIKTLMIYVHVTNARKAREHRGAWGDFDE